MKNIEGTIPIKLKNESDTNEILETKREINVVNDGSHLKITKNDSSPSFLTGLLAILLITSYIFIPKTFSLSENIIVDGAAVIYPITFLVIALMCRKYSFKVVRRTIYISSLLYLSFLFLLSMSVLIPANSDTSNYNLVVQYIFAGNMKDIGGITIYYPLFGQLLSIVLAYAISHLIYSLIYFNLKEFTMDYLAAFLSMFIAYIIDRSLFVPLFNINYVFGSEGEFNYFIKYLAGEFMITVFIVVLLLILYSVFSAIKKGSKKEV